MGCLPESTLWVHASPGATEEDTGMLSSASPSGDGGGVSVANATRDELPPTPLTAFVKVTLYQPYIGVCCGPYITFLLLADGPHHYHPANTCGHEGFFHLSPVHALRFLSRCKFSTLRTRQPMVGFYVLTFPCFPLRKKEHKSPTLVRIELTTFARARVQVTY